MSLAEKIKTRVGDGKVAQKAEAEAKELDWVNEQLSAVDVKINGLEEGINKLQTAYEKVGVSGAVFKKSYEELKKLFDDDVDSEVKAALAEKGITSVEGLRKEEQDEDIVEDEEVKAYKESQSESKPLAKELKETKDSITEKFGIDFKQLGVESKKVSGGEKTLIEERVKAKFEHDKMAVNEVLEKMKAERQELYEKTPQGRKEKEEKFGQKISYSLKPKNLPVLLSNPDYDRIVKNPELDLAKKFGQGGEEFVKNALKDEFGERIEAQTKEEKKPFEQDLQAIEQIGSIPRLQKEVFESIKEGQEKGQKISEQFAEKWDLDQKKVRDTIDHLGLLTIGDFYSSGGKNPLDLCEEWVRESEDKFNYGERDYPKNHLRDGQVQKILIEAERKKGKTGIPDYGKAKEFVDKYNLWLDAFKEAAEQIEAPKEASDMYDDLRSERQGWEEKWSSSERSKGALYHSRPLITLSPNVERVLTEANKQAHGQVDFFDKAKELLKSEIEQINSKGIEAKGLMGSKIEAEFAYEKETDYEKNNPEARRIAQKQEFSETSKKEANKLFAGLIEVTPNEQEAKTKIQLSYDSRGGGYRVDFVGFEEEEKELASKIATKQGEVGGYSENDLQNEREELEKKKNIFGIGKGKKQEALDRVTNQLVILGEVEVLKKAIGAKQQERINLGRKLAPVLKGMLQCGNQADWENIVGSEMTIESVLMGIKTKCQEIADRKLDIGGQSVLDEYAKIKKRTEEATKKYEAKKGELKQNK